MSENDGPGDVTADGPGDVGADGNGDVDAESEDSEGPPSGPVMRTPLKAFNFEVVGKWVNCGGANWTSDVWVNAFAGFPHGTTVDERLLSSPKEGDGWKPPQYDYYCGSADEVRGGRDPLFAALQDVCQISQELRYAAQKTENAAAGTENAAGAQHGHDAVADTAIQDDSAEHDEKEKRERVLAVIESEARAVAGADDTRSGPARSVLLRWEVDGVDGVHKHVLHYAFGNLDLPVISRLFDCSPKFFMQLLGMGNGYGGWMGTNNVLESVLFGCHSKLHVWNGFGVSEDDVAAGQGSEWTPISEAAIADLSSPSPSSSWAHVPPVSLDARQLAFARGNAQKFAKVLRWMCDSGVMTDSIFESVVPTTVWKQNGVSASTNWGDPDNEYRMPTNLAWGLLACLRFCNMQGPMRANLQAPHAQYPDLEEAIGIATQWRSLPTLERQGRTISLMTKVVSVDGYGDEF